MDGFRLKILKKHPENLGLLNIKEIYHSEKNRVWIGFISFEIERHVYHTRVHYKQSQTDNFEDFEDTIRKTKNNIKYEVNAFDKKRFKNEQTQGSYSISEFYRFIAREMKAYGEINGFIYKGIDFSNKFNEYKLKKMTKQHSCVSDMLTYIKNDWVKEFGLVEKEKVEK